jgi:hypothetical protein
MGTVFVGFSGEEVTLDMEEQIVGYQNDLRKISFDAVH